MRNTVAVLLGMVFTVNTYGQPTYMEIFRATGTPQGNMNELTSGNMLAGMAFESGTSLFNDEGNVLSSHCYNYDTLLALQSVKRYSDNEFYFAGIYNKDSCSVNGEIYLTHHPVVGVMDSLGNVVARWYYVLNGACPNTGGDLEVLDDKSVLVWGRDYRFFLLRADSTGAISWAKRFDHKGAVQFVKKLPGADLIVGMNMDTAGAVIARLTPNGEFVWCKSFIRPRGMVADCVIESDSAFTVVGLTDTTSSTDIFTPYPPNYHPKLFRMQLDGAGEVQWCKGYDNGYTWYSFGKIRMVATQDGAYVVLANLGYADYHRWYRPFLMKTNVNGDTLWTRSNGRANYTYVTTNLLAYSDGSIVYNGRIWGDLPDGQANWAFLYKADSLGHLPCYERSHPVVVSDLFPTDSSFTLISVDGATKYPAFGSDATYPPLSVYDGCSFTTGLSSQSRASRKVSVRPNPNTGHFTLAFKDPLSAESYYSVYDAMGKLLYQRPLPQGRETEEVDLSNFGKGTYVVKFTDKAGVCFERVVVE